ncbi:LLM class flavin-dependent oxidoreductase [Mycolicibacterium sp. OfavD-34-C]|uniref:LLM class flavin-dependent oxidoreductase n=1 Tax=Mycolicibacterium sp. OfavD-34-C TaxID=2917746 RepID=UPI001EF71414|nr:TIGR03619 family F420-dependent LLM class oxidoreductase [Mycolicibacterium sp. OfavD-34-C]MCG7580417.1 TIGR03619 family F420-dependent LLM class oxidoreductase [Mycolicibacterium sp. OfavD-34-C]
MKFGVGLPTGMEGLINPIPFFEPRQFLEAAKLAEQLGYDSVWGNDHYAPQNYVRSEYAAVPNFYEVLSVLAGVAAVTERVEIGTSVLVLPMRDIVTLARQTATIDQLSAGRLLLGVGIGAYPEEFHAARPDLAGGRRGEMLDEGLELLNRLLTEPTVTHHGKYYQVESLDMAPKGCADPVRILVGGHQLRGIDRAIRHGSGWIPGWRPFDELAEWIATLRERAADAGRDPHALTVAPQLSCLIGRHHETTERRYLDSGMVQHRKSLAFDGRDPAKSLHNNLIGGYAEVYDRVERLAAMGADHLACLTFCVDTVDDWFEQLELFATEVIRPYRRAHGIAEPAATRR